MNIFDIETGPLPEEYLCGVMPEFEANKTLKDPEKIAADIEKKRAAFIEKAALAPETGMVLAVGVIDSEKGFVLHAHQDERDTLTAFWDDIGYIGASSGWAGWNIHGFDLPFLIRRSWILCVPIPAWLRNGRYWDASLIDLMLLYSLGERDYISLDVAAGALGVGRKTGSGADFSKLWNGVPEQRIRAIEYLQNDLALTQKVARRIHPRAAA